MNYRIDRTLPEAAYMQLYRYLLRDITTGIYPCGTKLPSKRMIAEETGVSVITVEHAVRMLEEEGYVECRQRSGYVVRYQREDFFGKKEEQTGLPDEVSWNRHGDAISVSASEGQNAGADSVPATEHHAAFAAPGFAALGQSAAAISDSASADRIGTVPGFAVQGQSAAAFPFSVLSKTMRRVMLDYGERLLIKSPNHGCPELRNELCLYLARSRGIEVSASQVIVGSGAEYLYGLIVQLLGTGRSYALEDPSYHKIREVYQAMGAECELLRLAPDGIPAGELERTGAGILHVTPFHSFPSGVTADISKKLSYLRWAKDRNGIIVEDNYDSELTVSRKMEASMYSMDPEVNIIYVNTFSRTIAPSMRIGYMLLPERMVELFHEKLGFYSCTVPIFDQYVLAELLRSGDFERHVNRVRRQRRKQIAAGAFQQTMADRGAGG